MKMFLCFWEGDGGDSESHSVYYAKLVYAKDKKEALDKYLNSGKAFAHPSDRENYGCIELEENKIIK